MNAINASNCTALFTFNWRCVKALLRADILINKVFSDILVNALLYAAGETLENVPEDEIPDCLKFEDSKLQLKHICREAIRKHLLDLDLHQHLFGRIPKLGLPSALNRCLLFNETLDDDKSLDDDEFDEAVDNSDNNNDEN